MVEFRQDGTRPRTTLEEHITIQKHDIATSKDKPDFLTIRLLYIAGSTMIETGPYVAKMPKAGDDQIFHSRSVEAAFTR